MRNLYLKAREAVSRNCLRVSVALVAGVPVLASAQTTDPFDTALTEATTRVGGYAAALVGLSAVAVVFMIAMKYVKKIPRAS